MTTVRLAAVLACIAVACSDPPKPPVQHVADPPPVVADPKPVVHVKPKAPRHASHEHDHGAHPHPDGGHHHHPHPHPHLDGQDGHHHPY